MADIQRLKDALARISALPDSEVLDLQNLRQQVEPEERQVLGQIAARLGKPAELTVGELREFASDLFQAAGDGELSALEWSRTLGGGAIGTNPQHVLRGAFVAARAADRKLAAYGARNVRGVKRSDWTNDKTVRAGYLPASLVLQFGRGNSAALESFLDDLEGTGVNAVVVDIKESDGAILFEASSGGNGATGWNAELEGVLDATRVSHPADLAAISDALHARGMRVVARQVVFKDQALVRRHPESSILDRETKAPWGTNRKPKMWVNPWSGDARTYNIEIAKRALAAGADEIQFDYIRFPDRGTGDRERADYPGRPAGAHHCDAITSFLERANREIKKDFPLAKIGVDVFGYVATGSNRRDALGQDVGEMAKYVDVIWPMQYPSHWASKGGKAFGTTHPENLPRTVYERTTAGLIRQIGKRADEVEIRPWLQAFYLGSFGGLKMQSPESGQLGPYIQKQLDGARDGDANGYALWGRGEPMREVYDALEKDQRELHRDSSDAQRPRSNS